MEYKRLDVILILTKDIFHIYNIVTANVNTINNNNNNNKSNICF